VVGYFGRKLCGYKNKAIAEYFNRDPATLSDRIKKVEKMITTDQEFSILMERLEKKLLEFK
jgi:chromosomal replication initiation ATPase DnaA